jgi:hypothetical protein
MASLFECGVGEEAPMSKKFVTGASFALGGAGVVLVGYLSANPLAFTHPVAPLPSESRAQPQALVQTVAAATPAALVLPEVNISATIPKRERTVRQPAPLEPCSGWSEIGATLITPNGATGVHRVRLLCDHHPMGGSLPAAP